MCWYYLYCLFCAIINILIEFYYTSGLFYGRVFGYQIKDVIYDVVFVSWYSIALGFEDKITSAKGFLKLIFLILIKWPENIYE